MIGFDASTLRSFVFSVLIFVSKLMFLFVQYPLWCFLRYVGFIFKSIIGFYPNKFFKFVPKFLLQPIIILMEWSLKNPIVDKNDSSAYELIIVAEKNVTS